MTDQRVARGPMSRAPDLRLGDVRTSLIRAYAPFDHRIDERARGVFAFVRKGTLSLIVEGAAIPPIAAPAGTAAGFEDGRAHRWTSGALPAGAEIELFVSSIPHSMSVLQRLTNGLIVVPADAAPAARILRNAMELHLAEVETGGTEGDDAIVRRCAEICLIQLVRYARGHVGGVPAGPPGLAHDEKLLRAWSVYLAEPRRRWTLTALADAAGLGRTAFTERFRAVVGTPPLQTMRALRLDHAATMLRQGTAPLTEISFAAGYNSEAAFVRAFHRHHGMPPGRLRRRAGMGDA